MDARIVSSRFDRRVRAPVHTRHLLVAILIASCCTIAAGQADSPATAAAPNTSVSVEEAIDRTADPEATTTEATLPPRSQILENDKGPLRSRRSDARLEPTANDSKAWYRSAIGSLLIVLAIIAGAAWLVRRMVPSFRAYESGAMAILARTPISQRQAIALLQVGRRVLVIGFSPSRVDRLAEIEDPCEVAELLACAGGKAPGPRFNRILQERAEEFAADENADGLDAGIHANSKPISALLRRLKLLRKSA